MTFSITLVIIIITCIASFSALNNQQLFEGAAHHPYMEKNKGQYYRMLTSGFIHADFFHLFINMFVLYQFGNYVEMRFADLFGSIGPFIYLGFYLIMIVLANLSTHFKYAGNYNYRAIGASGATSAVLFSFIYFEPMSMLGIYLIIPMPAIIFGVLYLVYESWSAKKGHDNIGHDAHFFGAIAGFVVTFLIYPSYFSIFLDKIVYFFEGLF
ncbi:MAG: rhomboid family intramembrane serine protease [Saprospiraceae bacterium]